MAIVVRMTLVTAAAAAAAIALTLVANASSVELDQNREPTLVANKSARTQDDEEFLWLHAFDLGLCGRAVSGQSWQFSQSAFGCQQFRSNTNTSETEAKSRVGPRIYGGQYALEGELPFYVHITVPQPVTQCGATLIHDDLVVTSAYCVAGIPDLSDMRLVAGSNWRDERGGVVRAAKRWCWPKRYQTNGQRAIHDLAIIELAKPVPYLNNKIWPACVRLDAMHSDGAECAFAGMGAIGLGRGQEYSERLKTLRVRRDCSPPQKYWEQSCYKSSQGSGFQTTLGEGGIPVVCYDRCSHTGRQQVQAFAVASNSWGSISSYENYVADFAKLGHEFKALLREIRRDGFGSRTITCRNR